MEKTVICKNGKKQATFSITPTKKRSREFLENRNLRRVLRIEHKPMLLIAN